MHALKALAHPRWEDYNYEYLHEGNNRLHWLGDGQTVADKDPDADSKQCLLLNHMGKSPFF